MGWGKCLGIELRWQVHGLGASVWEEELRWQVHGLGQVFGNRIEVASTWVGASVWE